MVNTRGVIRTQSNIYDGVSFRKQLTAFNRSLFSQKSPIANVRLGSKYVSEYCNNFFSWRLQIKIIDFLIFFFND